MNRLREILLIICILRNGKVSYQSVVSLKCMCTQTRPRLRLSSKTDLGGLESESMLTPRGGGGGNSTDTQRMIKPTMLHHTGQHTTSWTTGAPTRPVRQHLCRKMTFTWYIHETLDLPCDMEPNFLILSFREYPGTSLQITSLFTDYKFVLKIWQCWSPTFLVRASHFVKCVKFLENHNVLNVHQIRSSETVIESNTLNILLVVIKLWLFWSRLKCNLPKTVAVL